MRFTLRQLEVFIAAAHHQNVTRAAAELSMSQSAASGALKELEKQFDIQLFDRIGKRLQLNELGKQVRSRAEAILSQSEELEGLLNRHDEIGHLRIGATLTIGNYLAVGIMARFRAKFPQARVGLEVANTSRIVKQVLSFELDIGLIEGEIHHRDLEVIPWLEDELVAFCSPDHPLANKQLDEQQMRQASWILREQGSGTRQTFDRAMHGLLPELDISLELQHTEAIKRAVEAGLGLGCLSQVTLSDAFQRGTLAPVYLPGKDLKRHFYFILHQEKYRSAGIQHWIELCNELIP